MPTTASVGLTRQRAYYGLGLLTLLNFLNYIDRYILAAVLPRVKTDLGLTDFQLSLLINGFLVSYFITSPLFGRLGDRLSRRRLIAAGVAAWSVATAAAGLATSFFQLLAARSCVGIGESSYSSVAPSLISDYFPKQERGRAFSIFYVAIPVGAAVGFVLGGQIEKHFGWRTAFLAVGLPGLILALLALTAPDPPRGTNEEVITGTSDASLGETLRTLASIPPYVGAVLGYTAYTFGIGGLSVWMPTFLERIRGVPLDRADNLVGPITVVAGLTGTFVGGWAGDRLLKRVPQAYLYLCAVSILIAVPLAWGALTLTSPPLYLSAFFLAEFFAFVSMGPINAAMINVVPISMRSMAMAVSMFVIHLLGDAISNPIIGKLSDEIGLDRAVLIVPASMLVSGIIWMLTAYRAREGRPQGVADCGLPIG